jgi:CopG family nickel-responsive transcriptional regulator
MAIISISMNDESLQALDDIQEAFGLSGRSEAVRAAINSTRSELQGLRGMSGHVEGVLILVRGDHADPWMNIIQAKYVHEIKTQLHSHLKDKKCLEVMVISAEAGRLSALISEIHAQGRADYVRFVRS